MNPQPDRGPFGRWIESIAIDRPARKISAANTAYRVSTVAATLALAIGITGLTGYALRIRMLTEFHGSFPSIYPNTAVALCCTSVAVFVGSWNREVPSGRASQFVWSMAIVAVATVGLVALILNALDAPRTPFDTWWWPKNFIEPTTPVAGRTATEACIAFVALALSLLLQRSRSQRTLVGGQVLAFSAASIGASGVMAYLLSHGDAPVSSGFLSVGMALPTAVGIVASGVSAVLVRPHDGIVGNLLDAGLAGRIGRRLALLIVAGPIGTTLLGAVLFAVINQERTARAAFTAVQVIVFSVLLVLPLAVLIPMETELRHELDQIRRNSEETDDIGVVLDAIRSGIASMDLQAPGWRGAMRAMAARGHVGGDFVQVLHDPDGESAVLVTLVDVAGHDARSSVLAYGLRVHIAALWERGAPLEALAASTNAKVVRQGTIATGVFVRLDGEQVSLVNAGHPAPWILRANHLVEVERTGRLFGLPEAKYEVRQETMSDGDVLVLVTDGIVEARSPDGRFLTEEALRAVVRTQARESVETIAQSVIDLALSHTTGRLDDDSVVIVLRRVAGP